MFWSIALPPQHAFPVTLRVRLFSPLLRVVWISTVLVTILIETVPIPLMAPVRFYSYCAAKALLFFLIGYVTPLALWRFNATNRGIALATISSVGVEALQAVIGHGHSFHLFELAAKLAIIFFGFVLGLNARYDRKLSLGPVSTFFVVQQNFDPSLSNKE